MSSGPRLLRAVPDLATPDIEEETEQRFARGAAIDRWVQRYGADLRSAYDERADAWTMLSLASGPWLAEEGVTRLADRAVAAVASAVGASVSINLEPACARLLWVSERERPGSDALDAAEHYALLGLASARRPSERAAAECVWEAARFLAEHGPTRQASLHRFVALAEGRLTNAASLVGSHLPFWRFPFAYRWSREAPSLGRGFTGLADPVAGHDGLAAFVLAYRAGRAREEIAGGIERCAAACRREPCLDPLAHARGTAVISEFAALLSERWTVPGARSAIDVVERIVPEVLSAPWESLGPVGARAQAARVARPVLSKLWPELLPIAAEHEAFRARQRDLSAVA